jgi:hypothetical protein
MPAAKLGRIVVDAKARNILVKLLAFNNANKACKGTLQPYRQRATLQEMVRIFVDVRLSHIQGIALSAALKEMFCPGEGKKKYVFPVEKRDILLGSVKITPTARYLGVCHWATNWCQRAQGSTPPHSRICPWCWRGKHWANECHSKSYIDKQPLIGQGKFQRDQPQPRQMVGGQSSCRFSTSTHH